MFEIAIFRYSDLHDGDDEVSPDKVICEFIEHYKHYFDPVYVDEGDVWFQRGKTWLSFRDKSGGDKPITIMLMGPITEQLVNDLKEEVKRVYMRTCWDCKKEFKDKTWAVCMDCRNK